MFQTEQELVNCMEKEFSFEKFNLLEGKKQSIFTELNLGYGIADMVLVGHGSSKIDRNNFLEYFDISLLNLLEKEDKTLDEIVYITKSPGKKVHSSLDSLIKEGFVTFREGKYFSHKKYASVLTDSVAIEAKLTDWRRALKQAYRYKWFANKSFVFLPMENTSAPQKNIHLFEQYNVGLAGVSKENGIEVLFEPITEDPISIKMQISLNEHLVLRLTQDAS